MHPDIFHRDFNPTPYWWEAYTPTAGNLIDVRRHARVAIVGGGYAGLSAALELAKHGIDAVVLEANELGFGASTRNGGAVSGGVNVGKSFTGKIVEVNGDRVERILSDAGDAFTLIDRLIDEEKSPVSGKNPAALSAPGQKSITMRNRAGWLCSMQRPSPARTWSRASASATKSPATIISAASLSSGRASCIRRSTTRVCSPHAAGEVSRCAPRPRSLASLERAAPGGSKAPAEASRPVKS
jgi:hypothetical protein